MNIDRIEPITMTSGKFLCIYRPDCLSVERDLHDCPQKPNMGRTVDTNITKLDNLVNIVIPIENIISFYLMEKIHVL